MHICQGEFNTDPAPNSCLSKHRFSQRWDSRSRHQNKPIESSIRRARLVYRGTELLLRTSEIYWCSSAI